MLRKVEAWLPTALAWVQWFKGWLTPHACVRRWLPRIYSEASSGGLHSPARPHALQSAPSDLFQLEALAQRQNLVRMQQQTAGQAGKLFPLQSLQAHQLRHHSNPGGLLAEKQMFSKGFQQLGSLAQQPQLLVSLKLRVWGIACCPAQLAEC